MLSAGGTRLAATEVKRRAHFSLKEYGCQSSRAAAREPSLPDSLLCFAMLDPLIVWGLFVKINFAKKNSQENIFITYFPAHDMI
ncbi:MAG: hypothetical protein HFG47_04790 [Lachnospiraceae bacterium]|nr:hypothetical protein [Lachnospiraceae bacterium]